MERSFQIDDGGRAQAGFKGYTGDCGVRAAAIASGRPYQEVYDLVLALAAKERPGARKLKRGKPRKRSHPRTGIWIETMHKLMYELGFLWVPTMGIGTGCKVHLVAAELPKGRLVVRVSHHYTAVLDGVIHDTYDPRRDTHCTRHDDGSPLRPNEWQNVVNGLICWVERRCVYGYWEPRA